MLRAILLLAASIVWITGCAPRQAIVPDISEKITPFIAQAPLSLREERQKSLYTDFLAHHYAPWQMEELNATYQEATWAIGYFANKSLYGENRLPLDRTRYEAWVSNAHFDAFNTLKRHAIVIHPSSLRLLPTMHPIFFDPSLPGEGYPFDYNQNSAIKAMTPLIVSHLSLDEGWAFVQSPFALGWLPVRDIAFLSSDQIDRIMRRPKIVVLKEKTPVYDANQSFLFYAKMATLFPHIGEEPAFYRIFVPKSCGRDLHLQKSLLPSGWSAPMPLAMTGTTIWRVAEELLGESYGWGGMVGNRDCSAMTRDFFAPFGIWLPRNSRDQAKIGRTIDLSGYTATEKEKIIIEQGVPFRTLLYLPGHIMLYVGHRDGKAYIMHNMWGIKTEGNGRHIIGRTVVTDLWIGKNLPNTDKNALLIERIVSMNIVVSR